MTNASKHIEECPINTSSFLTEMRSPLVRKRSPYCWTYTQSMGFDITE
ncbi:MAG: hypothetical protein F6K54_18380 [Okeania sp. SIO3B5]|nr:hypothetical protein [Okeania sp. SIO3B5]NEO54870.1 hypothetical protein [Okeania sp. SIO3B5]